MDSFVRRFIGASLGWLGFGVVLGVTMMFVPRAIAYRPAHVHANLLGFVSMMIFGVAYHIIPRFMGKPLYSSRLAVIHLVLANAGLSLMVGGWLAVAHALWGSMYVLRGGALLMAAGVFLFIYNIRRTMDTREVPVLTINRKKESA